MVWYINIFYPDSFEWEVYKDSVFTKKEKADAICKRLNENEVDGKEYEVYSFYLDPKNNW